MLIQDNTLSDTCVNCFATHEQSDTILLGIHLFKLSEKCHFRNMQCLKI